jgi:hypothetical protein
MNTPPPPPARFDWLLWLWWVVANGVGTASGWFLSGALGLWGTTRNLVGLLAYAALTGAVMVWFISRHPPTHQPDQNA